MLFKVAFEICGYKSCGVFKIAYFLFKIVWQNILTTFHSYAIDLIETLCLHSFSTKCQRNGVLLKSKFFRVCQSWELNNKTNKGAKILINRKTKKAHERIQKHCKGIFWFLSCLHDLRGSVFEIWHDMHHLSKTLLK